MNDGLVVNSFIDDTYRLFYSTVISPAEREAAYTIDGLLHNEVVQSDIHSTDTHGYNEIIFAVTHLLGISFAPRIADFKKQYLYSFDYVANVKRLGYKVVPRRKINTKLIEDNWDGILRFVATIKTKEVTASQLFRRLSSYSREHPLYRALKEFGKIIKTLFLLRYIDDVDLRKQIQKMLNKIEGSNKLANAVFHGKNKEFKYAGKNEQLVADACKRLIENSIICWNYAYLTNLIATADSKELKEILLETIKNKSVVAWEHINLGGTYDFSNDALSDEFNFKIEQLLNVTI
jgi:TnpA family transposase